MKNFATDFGRLRVWKEHLAVCQKLALLNVTSVLDEAFQDVAVKTRVLELLKESADNFFFEGAKRGFSRPFIRDRFEELAAAIDNHQNRN